MSGLDASTFDFWLGEWDCDFDGWESSPDGEEWTVNWEIRCRREESTGD